MAEQQDTRAKSLDAEQQQERRSLRNPIAQIQLVGAAISGFLLLILVAITLLVRYSSKTIKPAPRYLAEPTQSPPKPQSGDPLEGLRLHATGRPAHR